MPIRPKFSNFGKFLSKIFSPILLYCLKNFIKNFLEIVKIYARKSIRRQSHYIFRPACRQAGFGQAPRRYRITSGAVRPRQTRPPWADRTSELWGAGE